MGRKRVGLEMLTLLLCAGCRVVSDTEWKGVLDADGDGYSLMEDCDPTKAGINPDAPDPTQDGVDQNCDGVDGTDEDGDGFASAASGGTDCDDTDGTINPDATEICDGVDNDCDGLPEDSDAVDAMLWYRDADGDGYGDPDQPKTSCDTPNGFVANSLDCDDTDASAWSGANDYTMDGIDEDCDGIDGYPDSTCDSPNLTMELIPNGIFTMGSPEDEVGHEPDETQHEVTLTHEFCIAATEVTQGEYVALMGSNPSFFDTCGDNCPVENVSWDMAAACADALSENEGLDVCYSCTGSGIETVCDEVSDPYTCEGYRLPTEAEWEYAARDGLVGEAFPSGGSLVDGTESDCEDADLILGDGSSLASQAWFCGDSDRETHPVGEPLIGNGYGLYDMAGNVWEWVEDWYGDYGGDAADPTGAVSGSSRADRGGSWGNGPSFARVANRDVRIGPYGRDGYMGLRLARFLPYSD